VNGAGKSSLLKIIAGIDTDHDGEVRASGELLCPLPSLIYYVSDVKIGYLAQEPQLDVAKTVRENVLEGVADKLELLERYQELKQKLEENENVRTALCSLSHTDMVSQDEEAKRSLAEIQETVEEQKLEDLPRRVERAMDALRYVFRCLMFALDSLSIALAYFLCRCPPADSSVDKLSGVCSSSHYHFLANREGARVNAAALRCAVC
jgi:hypothetical protein